MSKMDISSKFSEKISQELNINRMWADAEKFSQWYRYSGSADGEDTVDFIVERMQSLGITVKREAYNIYRSLPLNASVEVIEGAKKRQYHATPYVYSGCANNLQGEVVFDACSTQKHITQKENAQRCSPLKGKIVLTYDNSYNFACAAKEAGALAILHIWNANIPHHGSLGGVWGTPGVDDMNRYPFIPFVELVKGDGEELRAFVEKGVVIISLNVEMDNHILETSMPIATIKGKSDKYVLVSGHYDSWYEGLTDNGVANVSMMELARVLNEHRDELKRTVVLAWWSGHSDGRYSGSTWYYDNNWKDLYDNCVAHINMDIAGCIGSDLVELNMSGIEGKEFSDKFLTEFNDQIPTDYIPMARFADQTFWGANVPFAIMPRFSKRSFDGGIFYWWHTAQDTLDKVSPEIMLRDCRVIAKLTCLFTNTVQLPANFPCFIDMMENCLNTIKKGLSPDFDLTSVYPYLNKLRSVTERLMQAAEDVEDTDDIILRVAGELTRITYTYSSPFYHDLAIPQKLFPVLSRAIGQTPENTCEDYYLFLQTDFIRQRNRLIAQICRINEDCEYQLLRWQLGKSFATDERSGIC